MLAFSSEILYNFSDETRGDIMRTFYQTEIEKRISAYKTGFVFSAFDFRDIAGTDVTNKALSRLNEEGKIRRVMQGYYDTPLYSELIKEFAAPDIEALANAIARKYNWTIAPAGDIALNIMHLSTQVPNTWEYISDGPTRQFEVGAYILKFKKCSNREISGKSRMTNLLIQAFKAIGKNNITDEHISKLKTVVKAEDIKTAQQEAFNTSEWIYTSICKLAKEM